MLGKNQHQIKVKNIKKVELSDLTSFLVPNQEKILFIGTANTYDDFYYRYGYFESDGTTYGIKWNDVANDYRGIGISKDFESNKEENYLSSNITFDLIKNSNWWNFENNTNFVEFEKRCDKYDVGSEKTEPDVCDDQEAPSINTNQRYFKLVDPDTGYLYGRYTGDTPKQAALKALIILLQKSKSNETDETKQTIVNIKECTRGYPKKIYRYLATKEKIIDDITDE